MRPTLFMLPFNIIGELSRTLALAVRLYGNMMSGSVIAAILIGFVPLVRADSDAAAGASSPESFKRISSQFWPWSTSPRRPRSLTRARIRVTTSADNFADQQKENKMDNLGLVALGSIVMSGLTIAIGSIAPALGEGRAVAQALSAIAQQPDASNTITRTLFVGLAMVESTAIYCFVVAMILLFANPFWNYFVQ